jgi:hypothetical protein
MTTTKEPARHQQKVSADQLATIFGDAEGRLAGLIKAGRIEQDSQGHVPLVAAVQTFLDDLRADLRSSSRTASAERARAARASAAELRLAEMNREVVPVEDLEYLTEYLAGAINTAIVAVSPRITRDIATRRQIDAAVTATRQALAADVERLAK